MHQGIVSHGEDTPLGKVGVVLAQHHVLEGASGHPIGWLSSLGMAAAIAQPARRR